MAIGVRKRLNTVVVVGVEDHEHCSLECPHFEPLNENEVSDFCRLYGRYLGWSACWVGAPSAPSRLRVCIDDPDLTIEEEF